MKNSIAEPNGRFKLAEERGCKPENSLIEFMKSEEQRKKNKEKRILEKCGMSLSAPTCAEWKYQKARKEKVAEKIFEEIIVEKH